jgi:hypothetical protein
MPASSLDWDALDRYEDRNCGHGREGDDFFRAGVHFFAFSPSLPGGRWLQGSRAGYAWGFIPSRWAQMLPKAPGGESNRRHTKSLVVRLGTTPRGQLAPLSYAPA